MSDNFGIKRVTIAKTKDESSSWSTKKVEEYKYNKMHNIKNIGPSPFFEDNINHRKADIAFNYTDEELEEISKCMESVEYFADKYCYAMTDNGVEKIELYPYQRETLKCFQNNRYVVYLASRQVGKCSFVNTNIETNRKKISISKLYSENKKQTFLEKIKNYFYFLLNKLDI